MKATRRPPWYQFTLCTMLAAMSFIAATLGCVCWKGGAGLCWFVGTSSVVGIIAATLTERKRLLTLSILSALAVAALIGLRYLGPHTVVFAYCSICGQERLTDEVLGFTWSDTRFETGDSAYYANVGLPRHEHKWCFIWINAYKWGKGTECIDGGFGRAFDLRALQLASERLDESTFQELLREYPETFGNPELLKEFRAKYRAVLLADPTWPPKDD